MKTFLVTGATGFLGVHLVDRLRKNRERDPGGVRLRLLSRGSHPWEADPGIETVRGDVRDRRAVDRAVACVSGIFHLAGLVTRNPSRTSTLYDTHVEGTRNICEAALTQGRPRVVVSSSSGTIAASRGPDLHIEDSPYTYEVTGHWPYYLSKIYQEKLALSYYAHHNLPVVVVNPSLLLGPGDDRRSSTGDIQTFLDGQILNVPSGGLNFVDVRDAAEVFVKAMEVGTPGRRYLVGGHNMSLHEFFRLLERASGVRAPRWYLPEGWAQRGAALLGFLYRLAGRTYPIDEVTVEMAYRFWYCDSTRAKTELGFAPRPAEETLRDTVAYMRERRSSRAPNRW
jgi:dihydroflavonol-4-reductase